MESTIKQAVAAIDNATNAARAAGVSRTTIIDAATRGDIVTFRTPGGLLLFDVADVRRWVAAKSKPKRRQVDTSGLF